jgi:exodeoxyribonuclease-5
MKLSDEQRQVCDSIKAELKAGDEVRLGGLAGTGKTTVIKTLLEELPGKWAVAAFAGKACEVLRRKGIPDAKTLHSLIYEASSELVDEDDLDLTRPSESTTTYGLSEGWSSGLSGLIVDEASMVPLDMYEIIAESGLPVLYTGDHGQLPPVGSKSNDDGKFNLMDEASLDHRLETVHRNAGPIAMFADHLRSGLPCWEHEPDSDDVRIVTAISDEDLIASDVVLTHRKSDVAFFNKKIRQILGYTEVLEQSEPIIVLQNCKVRDAVSSKETSVFNGQILTVVQILGSTQASIELVAETESGQLLQFVCNAHQFSHKDPIHCEYFVRNKSGDRIQNPNFLVPVGYAYALTTHKAQGSEWDSVLVADTMPMWNTDYFRWAYTSVTRAKSKLVFAKQHPARKSQN